MKKDVVSHDILQLLEDELPSWFTRKMAVEKLNGIFSNSTLTNYEYRKIGPPVHYMGRHACYMKESFMEWLRNHFDNLVVEQRGFRRYVRRRKKGEVVNDKSNGVGEEACGSTERTFGAGEEGGGSEA